MTILMVVTWYTVLKYLYASVLCQFARKAGLGYIVHLMSYNCFALFEALTCSIPGFDTTWDILDTLHSLGNYIMRINVIFEKALKNQVFYRTLYCHKRACGRISLPLPTWMEVMFSPLSVGWSLDYRFSQVFCLSVCLYVMDSSGGQRSQPILMKLDW